MNSAPTEHPVDPTTLEHEAYGWVVRFVSGEATKEDLRAVKAWSARSPAHAAAFDQASLVWKKLDEAEQKLILKDIATGTAEVVQPRMISRRPVMARRAFLGGALAASVAGAAVLVARPPLGLWPSLSELSADVRTEVGERRQVTLADSVSVDLNTRTSLAVRTDKQDGQAIELIAGEAMIATRADRPNVTLLASDGRITGTNARFNVRLDNSTVLVTCLDGDVRIMRDAVALTLPVGRQVAYSRQGMGTPVAIDPQIVTAWKDGVVIFDAMPIADVVAEVNRYRSGKIILTNAALGRERFNARFRIENIDRVLGQIAQVFGARVTSLPGGISLLG
jgi:transmembrane sensor